MMFVYDIYCSCGVCKRKALVISYNDVMINNITCPNTVFSHNTPHFLAMYVYLPSESDSSDEKQEGSRREVGNK